MERSHRQLIAIGAFVVGSIAIAITALLVMARGPLFGDRLEYVLYFESALDGLTEGAAVRFRGVRIGEVARIQLRAEYNGIIHTPVIISIDPAAIAHNGAESTPRALFDGLIKRGLKGRLKARSMLTGKLLIELVMQPEQFGYSSGSRDGDIEDRNIIVIPTVTSPMAQLIESLGEVPVEEIMGSTARTLEAAERLLSSPRLREASDSLVRLLGSLERLSGELEQRVPSLARELEITLSALRSDSRELSREVEGSLGALKQTLASAEKLLNSLEREVKPTRESLAATAAEARATLEQSRQTLAAGERVLAEDSNLMYRLALTLDEMSRAARAVKRLAELLERQPDAFIYGKGH